MIENMMSFMRSL